MEITINNQQYKIKQTIRALFLFEEITGRNFEIKSTIDNYIYFYCILLSNNSDFMTWDEFIDYLDENPQILIEITNALSQQNKIQDMLDRGKVDENGKKKD